MSDISRLILILLLLLAAIAFSAARHSSSEPGLSDGAGEVAGD